MSIEDELSIKSRRLYAYFSYSFATDMSFATKLHNCALYFHLPHQRTDADTARRQGCRARASCPRSAGSSRAQDRQMHEFGPCNAKSTGKLKERGVERTRTQRRRRQPRQHARSWELHEPAIGLLVFLVLHVLDELEVDVHLDLPVLQHPYWTKEAKAKSEKREMQKSPLQYAIAAAAGVGVAVYTFMPMIQGQKPAKRDPESQTGNSQHEAVEAPKATAAEAHPTNPQAESGSKSG
uniref:Uncharacterized protein n=1 Tax=Mycena chlorophos TaxID=658473 RepID=A0ABQ0MDB7_MYCCL|nr:predicted protein [Mycena chlorophos]